MDTKREIVLAMKEVFAEKGYMASMSDISKIVGIKVPSIYSHYQSKDEIIYLCIHDEIETFTQYYRSNLRRTQEESVEFSLKHLFFSYIEYFKDLNKLRFWNNFDLIPNLELRHTSLEAYKKYMSKLQEEIKALFLLGIEKGEIKSDLNTEAYLMYIVTIQGVLRGMLKFEGFDNPTDHYYAKIWEMYWETVKTY